MSISFANPPPRQVYETQISHYDSERGWSAYSGLDNLQLEFTMLDLHIRTALLRRGKVWPVSNRVPRSQLTRCVQIRSRLLPSRFDDTQSGHMGGGAGSMSSTFGGWGMMQKGGVGWLTVGVRWTWNTLSCPISTACPTRPTLQDSEGKPHTVTVTRRDTASLCSRRCTSCSSRARFPEPPFLFPRTSSISCI